MNFPLTSPGDAVSARAAWEHSLTGVARREVKLYLSRVEMAALQSDQLSAAVGDVFSWWRVLVPWGALAHALVSHLASLRGVGEREVIPYDEEALYVSPTPGDPYLSGAYSRLMEDPTPHLVIETVSVIVALAVEFAWSRARLADELRSALDPRTGSARSRRAAPEVAAPAHPFTLPELTTPGSSWSAMPELLARAEATGAYNSYALDQLARAGFTHKRWVTRHDDRVRPTHRAAEGQTAPLGSEFIVGGFALRYPADPAAPAVETAGCRCVVVGASL